MVFNPTHIKSAAEQEELALEIFHYQASENTVYKEYLKRINILTSEVNSVDSIPYLPIGLFKTHQVKTNFRPIDKFISSGTGGQSSTHFIKDYIIYENSFVNHFAHSFGSYKKYSHLALLPNYLEQENSSLVYQVNYFIKNSDKSGAFYLNEFDKLKRQLVTNKKSNTPTVLWGVTFALLDFIKDYQIDMSNLIIIETGGMKGRGKELIRKELHHKLKSAFPTSRISSEYGMTELFSQAYWDINKNYFTCHLSMKASCRELGDPFSRLPNQRHGALNIMDLNNWATCSFIATQDLGTCYDDGFEVHGRIDNSDARGCNLMYV